MDYENIDYLDSNKLSVQISAKDTGFSFVFNTVAEAVRFYSFSKKARQNLVEAYRAKKYEIKCNIDFCDLNLPLT